MKTKLSYIAFAIVVGLTACGKDFWEDLEHCPGEEIDCNNECSSDRFHDYDNIPAGVEHYVLQDIVYDDDCGCIVSGRVKYLENGMTVAMVDYGNGDCDDLATQVNCVSGDCEHEQATCCTFRHQCQAEN